MDCVSLFRTVLAGTMTFSEKYHQSVVFLIFLFYFADEL